MFEDIETGLFARVDSMVLTPVMPIAWPNRTTDKPSGREYIEVLHFPNIPIDRDWNNDATVFVGVLQMNVNFGVDYGTVYGARIVDQIVNTYWSKTTQFTSGSASFLIYATPRVGSPIQDGDRCYLPVSVLYQATAN